MKQKPLALTSEPFRAGMACIGATAHLLYAADALRADPGFILAAVCYRCSHRPHGACWNRRGHCFLNSRSASQVRLDGAALEYAAEDLRADRSIVHNAVCFPPTQRIPFPPPPATHVAIHNPRFMFQQLFVQRAKTRHIGAEVHVSEGRQIYTLLVHDDEL